jgi:uncharacterized protein YbaR (Trm112 family)
MINPAVRNDQMHKYLIDMLTCPVCHGELNWRIIQQTNERVEDAETRCTSCSRSYPIREEIGIFLIDEIPRNDLWEQVDSGLMKHLRSHPELFKQLMTVPLETLSPADQFFRGMLLEELGRFAKARRAHNTVMRGLYTSDYLDCFQSQVDYVINELASGEDPVVDLASGRCYLVEQLAAKLNRPLVATDFSIRVLKQDRKRLEFEGLYNRVSLLALDARHTPFKDNAIESLTTNLGLPNIEDPGALLKELRRVVRGSFFAISHFFPEGDRRNEEEIHKLKLETFMYRRTALEQFSDAKWQIEMRNVCTGRALPTPPSVIIEGLRNDALPVSETILEWCTLVAN